MSSPVFKDCGDIWNRLFDHRPFLSGEIKYFIKEFEENRGNREVTRLYNINDWITDLRDKHILKATESLPELNKVETLLGIANQTCNTILEEEDNFDLDKSLEQKRALRKTNWDSFKNTLTEKYTSIDKLFTANEKEVIDFYIELEKKSFV